MERLLLVHFHLLSFLLLILFLEVLFFIRQKPKHLVSLELDFLRSNFERFKLKELEFKMNILPS